MPLDASCLLRNSEDTLNTARDAAGDTTDRAADGSTNRAGRTAADSGALLCTTHNSSRPGRQQAWREQRGRLR